MHEYPLTLDIIAIATEYAHKANAAKVQKINLVIGDASGVSGDSIRLYFDEIAHGTTCETAALEITRVRPMLKCKVCGELFYRKPFLFACDKDGCSGEGEPTEVGREFYVKSIDV